MKNFFILLLLLSFNTQAQDLEDSSSIGGSPFYIDFSLGSGASWLSSAGDEPKLLQYSGGLTLAPMLGSSFFVGITNEFRFIKQFSEVNSVAFNYKGKRWVLSAPTIGMLFWKMIVKIEYHLFGSYDLDKIEQTFEGSIKYEKPRGIKLSILFWKVFDLFYLGLQLENIKFQSVANSSTGSSQLSTPVGMTQMGLSLTHKF